MAKLRPRIPSALRGNTRGRAAVSTEADYVGSALRRFAEQPAGLARHLFAESGKLRGPAAEYLNEEELRYGVREATRLRDGDPVAIVPAIAGGAPPPRRGRTARPRAKPGPAFSPQEMRRYSRHMLLPEVGVAGQRKLRGSKVILVGAGGLGAPAALYLAAAGVGELGIVDFDVVEPSNLQRQVLYGTKDVGRAKLEAARARLEDLNPDVAVRTYGERLSRENALELLAPYDVVIDGTDNFPTRYLVNDATVLLGKPNVYGSVYRFEGQASVFDARRGPCYRCLYPEPPPPGLVPSCAEGGVLGVLPGLIGTLQAVEAIKLILGIGEPLIGRLLLFDALSLGFHELTLRKNPDCVLCGPHATQRGLIDYPAFCGVAGTEGASEGLPEITVEELADRIKSEDPPYLLDVRELGEWEIAHIAKAHLIPRSELAERVTELSRAREVVVYCKSGARSALATRMLLDLGFNNVRNLQGGLDAWSERIDPTMVRY